MPFCDEHGLGVRPEIWVIALHVEIASDMAGLPILEQKLGAQQEDSEFIRLIDDARAAAPSASS
jgi:hypothetical protein